MKARTLGQMPLLLTHYQAADGTKLKQRATMAFESYCISIWAKTEHLLNDLSAYSRGDLSLHEYEDENQQGRDHGGPHHPNRERLFISKGADKPAPLVRRCDWETRGDIQLLQPQKTQALVTQGFIGYSALPNQPHCNTDSDETWLQLQARV